MLIVLQGGQRERMCQWPFVFAVRFVVENGQDVVTLISSRGEDVICIALRPSVGLSLPQDS